MDLVVFQFITDIMNPSLQEDIIEMYQQSLSWYQPFLVQHDDVALDLSHACRSCDSSSLCAPDQPKQLPNGLIYCFDTSFCGKPGWNSLKKIIKNSLPGSDLIECRTCCSLSLNCFRYTLHCNRYKCLETKNKKEYNDNGFTQSGVRHETVKRTKTNDASSTIDVMATKTELRAMNNQTVTLSSKVHRKKRMYPTKRQTKSQRPEMSTEKCNCQISILLWKDTYFYLDAIHQSSSYKPSIHSTNYQKFGIV
jgi:hypothetical protein